MSEVPSTPIEPMDSMHNLPLQPSTPDYKAIRDRIIEMTRLNMEEWTRGERTDFWLEENSENRAFYPIVKYIDAKLNEGTRLILEMLPLHRLQGIKKQLPTDNIQWASGIGAIPVPRDFIKLEGIKLASWDRPEYTTCKLGDDDYKVQQNPYTRGKKAIPKIGIAYGYLELYSMKPEDCVCYAYYIPNIPAEYTNQELWSLIALQTAILVVQVFGDAEKVQALSAQLEAMLTTANV